jgi:uncharacterized protein YcnI
LIRLVLALAAAGSLAAPSHVEPQSSEAQAGARTTFSFVVEHGCDGSPTVGVAIQIPEGAFDVVPVAPEGWTGAVEAATQPVVRFTGGPLPDDVEQAFGFELVTPNRPGETILFPTVQTCEAGEIAWIDPADESEEPAPRVLLTPNDQPILPTTTTSAPPTSTTTSAPSTTAPDEGDDGDGADGGDGDGGIPAWLIGAVALVAAGGVALVASRRRAGRHS